MIHNDLVKLLALNKTILCQLSEIMDNEINKWIRKYWFVYKHVEELVSSQHIVLGIIKQFVEEEEPTIKGIYPENRIIKEKSNVKRMVKRFSEIREEQIKVLSEADEGIWKKEGRDERNKRYTLEMLLRDGISYEAFQMWRMEEIWIEKGK